MRATEIVCIIDCKNRITSPRNKYRLAFAVDLVGAVDHGNIDCQSHLRDVADDLVGPGLAEGELVLIEAEPLHQVGEGLDGEDVMLGGDRAELADGIPAAEAVLVEGHLIHDLPRVDQELLSLPCNGELAAAVEDPDAVLVLDILKGRREAGL